MRRHRAGAGGEILRLEFEAKAPTVARDSAGWRGNIASAAQAAMLDLDLDMTEGPARVKAMFVLPRPKSASSKIVGHVTLPDIFTLSLAVRDGIKGIVIREPAQVTDLWVDKVYARGEIIPHVSITVGGL